MIFQYNENVAKSLTLPQIDESYKKLYTVINLGFEVVRFSQMPLQALQNRYPGADKAFVEYLKFLKIDLRPKELYKWFDLLEKYFDFCQNKDFEKVF